MNKILYISANPKEVKDSYCLQIGDAFLKAYQENNPNDKIKKIDLYKNPPQLVDKDVLTAWDKLARKESFESLTEIEKEKITKINNTSDYFAGFDKYIFVHPMWNFGIPPLLKAYFDSTAIAQKTFKYTPSGPIGLLENKKALLIQASGGVYTGTDFDFANKYVKTILGFMGIKDTHSILIQGTAIYKDTIEKTKSDTIEQANKLAKEF